MARNNHINGLFARFSQRDMRSTAYRQLPHIAKAAIFELDLHYWESGRSNPIELSQRWFAEILDCDPKTAGKVIAYLNDFGFLELERIGKLKGPIRSRAAVYRITWHPDNEGQPATFNFRSWQDVAPDSGVGKVPASTRRKVTPNMGKLGDRRATFAPVGETTIEMIRSAKAQQNRETEAFSK